MQENTLKSELNSMISNNHSSEPSMAQKDARDDFDSIKEQIKFAVSQQDYYTSSDGLHEVRISAKEWLKIMTVITVLYLQ